MHEYMDTFVGQISIDLTYQAIYYDIHINVNLQIQHSFHQKNK